ncbi:unnamed protein product [Arabidopsis halleri]
MKQFQSFQLSQRALAMDLQASLCFIAEIRVLHLAKLSHAASKQHQQSSMQHGESENNRIFNSRSIRSIQNLIARGIKNNYLVRQCIRLFTDT